MKMKIYYRAILIAGLLTVNLATWADDSNDQVYGDSSSMSTSQRLTVLERQMTNLNQQSFASKIQDMQGQIDQLRGRNDELQHQISQLNDQLKQQYQDLNQRVTTFTSKATTAAAESGVSASDAQKAKALEANEAAMDNASAATKPIDTKQEAAAYQKAFNLLKKKDYVRAVKHFEDFLSKYPNGPHASNGHFWLGEIHLLQGQLDGALTEYRRVVNDFPASDKVPMAEVRIGFALRDQGNSVKAKAQFQKVVKNYKGTPAAKIAADQLLQMNMSTKAS